MTEKLVLTTTTWSVQLPPENGQTASADFDTETNARAAWQDNQPSLLVKTTEETYMTGEVLTAWLAHTAPEGATS